MIAAHSATGRLPPAPPGLAIGLFGGSFDPPHQGHVMVSDTALRRLALDRVWWLVSPGNPLKSNAPEAGLAARIQAIAALVHDPRATIAGIEATIGTRYTVDTIRFLVRRFPAIRFVWLMGADNLRQFHLWQGWREIAASVPIAVIDRPGAHFAALASPAARALLPYRLAESEAPELAHYRAPAWVFVHGRRLSISSTELRDRR